MANSKSALKRVRQTQMRTDRNRALRSRVKTFRKRVSAAVDAGDSTAARSAYDRFASAADKAAKKGAIHKNTASRLKSRAATRVKSLSA